MIVEVLSLVALAAIVYMLVRPGSPAGDVVVALGDLVKGVVGTATGAVFVKGEQK